MGIFNRQGHLTTAIQNDGQAGTLLLYNGTSKETKLVGLRSGLYGGGNRGEQRSGAAHRHYGQ